MMIHIHNGIEFKEGDTVQHFHDGRWWSCELMYDGFLGWYVDLGDDGEELIKDWDKIRENVLDEPHGYKRVQLTEYASARVSIDVSQEVIDALKRLAEIAYENAEELILNVKKES